MSKHIEEVNVWVEEVVIPTYEIGVAEKNPIFSEKRVYQGSSGKVYPYPVVEKIMDVKEDKVYLAVYLENSYIRVMILPELGGRIQRAYDKTNQYDFVYHNKVIKPALVGLTGPWISGGIEFNWPQHHRPTTYRPVDYQLADNGDGSKTVYVHDVDQMYGTKGIAGFTLYPDKAYIEVKGQLYNRTAFPQTFLWWANPAVAVNDYTQSIFPPDVHAVMDHGKRDVSRYPIATGVYYKKDYSEGVDISRYKNIPVPTSYMAEKSEYDFVGGYDHKLKAGILHVADHHISPGKKQWTWGCGDFGKAWDRNLTDEDGPYIELMTGVYTDNQPDFTWLKPFEEKTFKQYFMPYKAVGEVKNATIHAAVNMVCNNGAVYLCIYATSVYENAKVLLTNTHTKDICCEESVYLSPTAIFEKTVPALYEKETELCVQVLNQKGELLVEYRPEEITIKEFPKPAAPAKEPHEIMTNEELYLTGLHIEQYRHATYEPDHYYLEGLKRDAGDMRINNAYGRLLFQRGLFTEAEIYFNRAIERMTWKNPNAYDSEPYYNLGLSYYYQGRYKEAYDAFYKSVWSSEQQEMGYYYLGAIAALWKNYKEALEFVDKALIKNSHHIKARGLKGTLLRKLGLKEGAEKWNMDSLTIDPFDYVTQFEQYFLSGDKELLPIINNRMRNYHENYLLTARDYAEGGFYTEAVQILRCCSGESPMLKYYEGYYLGMSGHEDEAVKALKVASQRNPSYCFPNKLEDIIVLRYAMEHNRNDSKAPYYLGTLFYDKRQYTQSKLLWEKSYELDQEYPTLLRNLAMAYYNKFDMPCKAKEMLERAFSLDSSDARILLELDQLYKKLEYTVEDRHDFCIRHWDTLCKRDDLYIEYTTLLNQMGMHEEALKLLTERKLHPWEGGEGKAPAQYKTALFEIGKKKQKSNEHEEAIKCFERALIYPVSLGEGKLEGTKDNHLFYHIGLSYEQLGSFCKAEEYYRLASVGTDEVAGMMYYYDQPADMILYQGLALIKLAEPASANARFYKLIDYGERHVYDQVKIEYFAVSLPDFLIFNEDWNKRNQVHCYYLMGLGNLGLGNMNEASQYFAKALSLDKNHLNSILYAKGIEI